MKKIFQYKSALPFQPCNSWNCVGLSQLELRNFFVYNIIIISFTLYHICPDLVVVYLDPYIPSLQRNIAVFLIHYNDDSSFNTTSQYLAYNIKNNG